MATPILSSTALLTVLLAVGLVFFIRASTKDRIEIARLTAAQSEASLLEQIQTYFTQRAYRIAAVDAAQNQVIFEGMVRPSVFLAIFLTVLAAVGILCLTLVLSVLLPGAKVLPGLALLSPLAGAFYWQKSGRREQVSLQVKTLNGEDRSVQSLITVTAHRDELAELKKALGLKPLEADY